MSSPFNTVPDRLSSGNLLAILESWMDSHNTSSFPWVVRSPKDVEVALLRELYRAPKGKCLCGHTEREHITKPKSSACGECYCPKFQDKIIMVGKLDLAAWLLSDNTQPCPVDHKFPGNVDAKFVNRYKLDSQLTGYMWLLEPRAKRPALIGFIHAIETSKLPMSDRKCVEHGVPHSECYPMHIKVQLIEVHRTPQQIKDWKRNAIKQAKKYRRLLYNRLEDVRSVDIEGTFNGTCSYCEFREWCLSDRTVSQVNGMFHQEPWAPWEHARIKGELDPTAMYVDNSILQSTAGCSTQAWMRYGLGWTSVEQSAPLAAGTAGHAAMEVWWKGGSEKKALAAFEESYTQQQEE